LSEIPPKDESSSGTEVRTRSFRKWQPNATLTPDQARRQTAVLRLAHDGLSSRDATVAFLNSYNRQLDGVPLHLALESEEGLLRVEQLLMKEKAKRQPVAKLGASQ